MPRLFYILSLLLLSQSVFSQNAVAFVGNIGDRTPNPKYITKAPAIVYIPFALEGGMIFVDAEIDGQKASFILDTGAPGLVINNLGNEKGVETKVEGIQGETSVSEVKVTSFNWAGLKHQEISAFLMDMSSFEELTGRNIKGLIGYEFFKDQEMLLDFDNQMIRLTRVNGKSSSRKKRIESVPFQHLSHLPIVKMKVNGKTGYFGLDTGSEVNIIHSRWKKKMKSGLIQSNQIVGVDGASKKVESTSIENTKIGNQSMEEMDFHFVNLSTIEKEYNVQLDGILGFPFFSTNKVSIDFEKQELSFYKTK